LKHKDIKLFTSSDIITTLYYVGAKIDKDSILDKIANVNITVKVIDF